MTNSEAIMRLMGDKAPNMNHETGIHYGVIPRNACNSDSVEEIYSNGNDVGYENMIEEAKANIRRELADLDFPATANHEDYRKAATNAFKAVDWDLKDVAMDDIVDFLMACNNLDEAVGVIWDEVTDSGTFGDCYESSGPYTLDDGEVQVQVGEDGDIWIFKSRFYTLCGECSPCAPNAGYLTTRKDQMKAYALPESWFDAHKPDAEDYERSWMPYNLYRVDDNSLVARGRDEDGKELEDSDA